MTQIQSDFKLDSSCINRSVEINVSESASVCTSVKSATSFIKVF